MVFSGLLAIVPACSNCITYGCSGITAHQRKNFHPTHPGEKTRQGGLTGLDWEVSGAGQQSLWLRSYKTA